MHCALHQCNESISAQSFWAIIFLKAYSSCLGIDIESRGTLIQWRIGNVRRSCLLWQKSNFQIIHNDSSIQPPPAWKKWSGKRVLSTSSHIDQITIINFWNVFPSFHELFDRVIHMCMEQSIRLWNNPYIYGTIHMFMEQSIRLWNNP